jgi:signal transduction histidine kinase
VRRFSLWPRNLAAQIALVVAIALFVAQAINFGLLLRERRSVRLAQVTGPTVVRLIDFTERASASRREGGRSRVRLVPTNPIDPSLPRNADVEAALAEELRDTNISFGRIVTGIRAIPRNDPFFKMMGTRRAERARRMGAEMQIAVEQPGKGWLVLGSPWLRNERGLIWQLFAQTMVLYAIVLIPLLWAAHRIARPLRTLAVAARGFRPGGGNEPVVEAGPSDVRDVIAAYNTLSLRVNAMLEEKDRMLGAIGHDLRTPLAALRVRVESVEDDTDRARMADTIDEMTRTLEDILSLARLGRPSEPATETDVAALIDAVVDDFRELDHDVAFEECPRFIMRMRPTLMRRAVRNLIENAVKYAGAAEVRLVPGDKQVAIEVCDRGPGIPQAQLDAVFDPFTRLETSRNRDTGGIGLGLALARAIVREAGGDIALANRDGGGLVATITLVRA